MSPILAIFQTFQMLQFWSPYVEKRAQIDSNFVICPFENKGFWYSIRERLHVTSKVQPHVTCVCTLFLQSIFRIRRSREGRSIRRRTSTAYLSSFCLRPQESKDLQLKNEKEFVNQTHVLFQLLLCIF